MGIFAGLKDTEIFSLIVIPSAGTYQRGREVWYSLRAEKTGEEVV